jgi:N-acetylmuramoyl-L-alanine amidase
MSIITLTAGHSAADPGAVNGQHTEAALMTALRNEVAAHLRNLGHEVRTDGSGAYNLPRQDAIKLIAGSAIAIELHANAATDPQANGIEVVALPKDKLRAQKLASSIGSATGRRLRGNKGWIDQSATHHGKLAYVQAGGLIVETFFLSNPTELSRYLVAKDAVAQALAVCIDGLAA